MAQPQAGLVEESRRGKFFSSQLPASHPSCSPVLGSFLTPDLPSPNLLHSSRPDHPDAQLSSSLQERLLPWKLLVHWMSFSPNCLQLVPPLCSFHPGLSLPPLCPSETFPVALAACLLARQKRSCVSARAQLRTMVQRMNGECGERATSCPPALPRCPPFQERACVCRMKSH